MVARASQSEREAKRAVSTTVAAICMQHWWRRCTAEKSVPHSAHRAVVRAGARFRAKATKLEVQAKRDALRVQEVEMELKGARIDQ